MPSQRRTATGPRSQRVARTATLEASTMPVRFTRCDRGPVAVRVFGQHALQMRPAKPSPEKIPCLKIKSPIALGPSGKNTM